MPINGDVVTFSYQSFSKDTGYVNAAVIRKREDMSWETLIETHMKEAPRSGELNGTLFSTQ